MTTPATPVETVSRWAEGARKALEDYHRALSDGLGGALAASKLAIGLEETFAAELTGPHVTDARLVEVQDAIAALVKADRERAWQPIETYPPCDCGDPACEWGPEVLLLIPHDAGAHIFIGHREAGEWLYRYPEDLVSWTAGERAPTHWQPLPPLPSNEQVR